MHSILAYTPLDSSPNIFACLAEDGAVYLYHLDTNSYEDLQGVRLNIDTTAPVTTCTCAQYLCFAEQFGLQAAVINMQTGNIQYFARQDYHCRAYTYSTAFFLDGEKTMFLHQSEWNRLDITDMETGAIITQREVDYERKLNYRDYFHSKLLVSPNAQYFISNGWIWSPVDNITCYSLKDFIQQYEMCTIAIDFYGGYNWDRPCTFIDDTHFVVAVDNTKGESDFMDEDKENYEYRQLWFYEINPKLVEERGNHSILQSVKKINCDVLDINEYGEVSGELFYDKKQNILICMSTAGTSLLRLDGQLMAFNKHLVSSPRNTHSDMGSTYQKNSGWKYSKVHRYFYCFNQGNNSFETLGLDELCH